MSNSRRSFITKAALAASMAPFASLSKTYGQGLENAMDRTSKLSSPSDLKITDVKCGYSGGGLFVKILTNQDIVGWGEGVDAVGGTYHLVQRLGRQLNGRSPLSPNVIFEQFRKQAFFWRRTIRHVCSSVKCIRYSFVGSYRQGIRLTYSSIDGWKIS